MQAGARMERRAKLREIKQWPGRVGGYSEKDWLDLQRRQDYRCAHCGRSRRLFRVRKVPPSKGGTNFIGNIIGLCDECKDWMHGKCYSQLRYLVPASELRIQRQGGLRGAGKAFPYRRHQRFMSLAVERGFMREPGVAYLATDPDACTCTRGQAPHRLGSPVCRNR